MVSLSLLTARYSDSEYQSVPDIEQERGKQGAGDSIPEGLWVGRRVPVLSSGRDGAIQ